jgi:hypothetical protein
MNEFYYSEIFFSKYNYIQVYKHLRCIGLNCNAHSSRSYFAKTEHTKKIKKKVFGISYNHFIYKISDTAVILIFELFANLPNRIQISKAPKIELNSKRIRTKFEHNPSQSILILVLIRIRYDFISIIGASEIRIRFSKFAKN